MDHDTNDILEILGQPPSLALYINNCVCFPMTDDRSFPDIVAKLSVGFERLTASFPWVTGQVINEGAKEGHFGVFKIKKSHETSRLITKDLRGDSGVPSMETLRQAKFPISMLDERVFSARRVVPQTDSALVTKPVLLLQANFVKGGFFLTFSGHYQTMDGTGEGLIMDLFDKACRNQAFTKEEFIRWKYFPPRSHTYAQRIIQ